MELHHSSIFEANADAIPNELALIHGGTTRTWRSFDDRAARLASAFLARGITRNSKVAIMLYNCPEWLETFHGALKIRAVPINVNYRYLGDELVYLLDNADAEALVFDGYFSAVVSAAANQLPKVRSYVCVNRYSQDAAAVTEGFHDEYESLIASHRAAERTTRDETDVYFTYTGGTTGLPKGVINPVGMMAKAALLFAPGGLAISNWPETYSTEFAVNLRRSGCAPVTCPAVPLMHSSGLSMGALPTLLVGGTVVTLTSPSFHAAQLFDKVGLRGVTSIVIAGDAIARPMLWELRNAHKAGKCYRLDSLRSIMSAGVAWSADIKAGLFDFLPDDVVLQDACGSTEGGIGYRIIRKGDPLSTNSFTPVPGLKVLREDGCEVEAGSDEPGRIATPSTSLGYYKDDTRTKKTYLDIDGQRYVLAGDLALRQKDGSIILLGRGTSVINSGGEKVFPEEVEDAVKRMDGVADCLVVGIPHERFGEQVAAVVSMREGFSTSSEEVIAHVRHQLAAYKTPRRVVFVSDVPRHPNGKPDFKHAVELAS